MEKRYGVTVESVAADLVCKLATSYWNGYNDVSDSEIESRFGNGVIDSTRQHAKEIFPDRSMLNPKVIKDVQHTAEAKRDSVVGLVIVSFDVTASGLPRNLKIQQGLGHGLDEKALNAVRNLRFQSNTEKETVYNIKEDTILHDIDENTILWEMAVPVEFFFSNKEE
jgi:TonB family protein